MKKAIRILSTILAVSIAAAVYCIILAPLLEPASKYQKVVLTHIDTSIATQQIMTLFNPNDWEVNSAQHLEINNYHIFVGEDSNLEGNSINIKKCTIVILSSLNPPKAILVQCLGNITLTFARPPSFQDPQSDNRLLKGSLNGKIRMVSKGAGENISFETEDFNIDKDRIWTRANVFFKYGRTQGVGSGMQIQLINHGLFASSDHNLDSGIISQKIENITLHKLQRLTIFPPVKKDGSSTNKSELFNSPVELRCDGQFTFNALNKYASFEQNVSLIQTVSNKSPNSIRCQYLILHFASPNSSESDQQGNESENAANSEKQFNEWDLQLERLEANGSPVIIEAPEYETKIYASRLIANLNPLSFELDSTTTNQQCEIHYKNHIVSTQNLIYKLGKSGTLGTLECNCAGWISSQMEQSGKQIRARWKNSLHLEPDHNDPTESIVSIEGFARLEMENHNKTEAAITADGFFFWLTQKSNPGASNELGELSLSRMQANENVAMSSNPITAKVKTLQLWFENLDDAENNGAKQNAGSGNAGVSPVLNSDGSLADSFSQDMTPYNVTGNLLQGKILLGHGQLQISELTLKDGIRIVQNNPSSDGSAADGKLEMSGSQIQVFNLTLPSATASLIGQPAKIRFNNMLLTGSAINVNKGINHIWIDSGGEALFNMQNSGKEAESQNANDSPAPQISSAMGEPAKVEWSKSMDFQNDTLTFSGNVSLQRRNQFAQCDALSIILNKKIDFQNLNSNELKNSLDVHYIVLNNSVKLENVTAKNGVTAAMDCLTASKITIDMKKRSFAAEGPGRAMTQRKMKRDDEAGEGGKQETADNSDSPEANSTTPLSQLAANSSQLINLSVDFQKRLEGTFVPHSLSTFTFSGYVEAVYIPIDEIGKPIKTFNISELPPQAFTLKCTQMEIQTELDNAEFVTGKSEETPKSPADASLAGNGASPPRNSSFIASGGITLEGKVYNAKADKVTFEAKNGIMTLEGDGQIPAQFFYQKVLGGRYNQASSSVIHYNTQTGAVKGEGIQDFSLFLTPKNATE